MVVVVHSLLVVVVLLRERGRALVPLVLLLHLLHPLLVHHGGLRLPLPQGLLLRLRRRWGQHSGGQLPYGHYGRVHRRRRRLLGLGRRRHDILRRRGREGALLLWRGESVRHADDVNDGGVVHH